MSEGEERSADGTAREDVDGVRGVTVEVEIGVTGLVGGAATMSGGRDEAVGRGRAVVLGVNELVPQSGRADVGCGTKAAIVEGERRKIGGAQ